MTHSHEDIEEFVRAIVREVEAAEAEGVTTPAALADRFNAKGLTTRKGRRWNEAAMRKFLASPGARRFRGGG